MAGSERVEYRFHGDGLTNPSAQKGLETLLVAEIAATKGASRICDLGCGNGELVARLSSLGYKVLGIDSSPTGIEIARTAASGPAAQFVCANIDEALPEPILERHGPFDVVVSSDVIEHMFRPGALVAAAYRMLRPGGTLIVGTPYHGYLKNLAISLLDGWDAHHHVHWDGGHIKFFSVRALTGLVEKQGFAQVRFRFFGRMPFLWKNMICICRRSAKSKGAG